MTPMAASGKSFQNVFYGELHVVLSRAIGYDYATIAREGKQGVAGERIAVRKISAPFRASVLACACALAANTALTAAFYVLYPVLLAMLSLRKARCLFLACVPAAGFVCLRVSRTVQCTASVRAAFY